MMKKLLSYGIILALVLSLFSGCAPQNLPATQSTAGQTTGATIPESSAPTNPTAPTVGTTAPATVPSTALPTAPEHSELYIPTVSVEEAILYFNEVCLDAEIVNQGDPTKLQRWETPIRYICYGTLTDADRNTLNTFVDWLNTIEGFPGMQETQDPSLANLRIHFCDPAEYLTLMGDGFSGTDGGVTFWYNGANEIYDAVIGYRTDVDQQIRNSVILEEIYNGLGPINDTELRRTSVIYAGFSTPQSLSEEDKLILKLLYHPQMQCGMDAAQCEAVIRQLYY